MIEQKVKVLIIDDEEIVRDLLYEELSEHGYVCTLASDGNEAIMKLSTQDFQIVLLDIRLPDLSGMDVLVKIRSNHPDIAIIMITAVNEVDSAVEAMKLGAFDYIVKPFHLDRINVSLETALGNRAHSERSYFRGASSLQGSGQDNLPAQEFYNRMDAIAYGVEARIDLLFCYSKKVIQDTVDIARQLDIPDKEVQEWSSARETACSKRDRAIRSYLRKLECNSLAQKMLGLAPEYSYEPKTDRHQN